MMSQIKFIEYLDHFQIIENTETLIAKSIYSCLLITKKLKDKFTSVNEYVSYFEKAYVSKNYDFCQQKDLCF